MGGGHCQGGLSYRASEGISDLKGHLNGTSSHKKSNMISRLGRGEVSYEALCPCADKESRGDRWVLIWAQLPTQAQMNDGRKAFIGGPSVLPILLLYAKCAIAVA
jgi:hypothetical protein